MREAVQSLASSTARLKEMAECLMGWKKGTWDTALQAQMSYRASEAPSQSLAFLGIVKILLEHVSPSRKSGLLSVGGFIEFQHSLDGTELEKKLLIFLPSQSLIQDECIRTRNIGGNSCGWCEMVFSERSSLAVLYCSTIVLENFINIKVSCV